MQFINLFDSFKLVLSVVIFVILLKILLDWVYLLIFRLFYIPINGIKFRNMLIAVLFKQ